MAHSTLAQDAWDRALRRPDGGQRANLDLGSLGDGTANGCWAYSECTLDAYSSLPSRLAATRPTRANGNEREHTRANSVLSLRNPNRRRKQRCRLAFRLFRRRGGSFTSR